jgi:hypothetical protein
MTHASAEQLYDLERQVRALAEEVDEARRIIPALRGQTAALRPFVERAATYAHTPTCDGPCHACEARALLADAGQP